MAKEVDYDSLKEGLNSSRNRVSYKEIRDKEREGRIRKGYNSVNKTLDEIGEGEFSFRRNRDLISPKKGDEKYSQGTKEQNEYFLATGLRNVNLFLNKGDFEEAAKWTSFISEKLQESSNFYTQEEKLKYLEGLNRRIERANAFLKKHPSEKNVRYMKSILNSYEKIEGQLIGSKEKYSTLEKYLTFLSLGAIIAGIVLGYPALTGNVVAENSGRFMGAGASLFILGLIGIFLANKK